MPRLDRHAEPLPGQQVQLIEGAHIVDGRAEPDLQVGLLGTADVATVMLGDPLGDRLRIVDQRERVAHCAGGGVHAFVRRKRSAHLKCIQPQGGRGQDE